MLPSSGSESHFFMEYIAAEMWWAEAIEGSVLPRRLPWRWASSGIAYTTPSQHCAYSPSVVWGWIKSRVNTYQPIEIVDLMLTLKVSPPVITMYASVWLPTWSNIAAESQIVWVCSKVEIMKITKITRNWSHSHFLNLIQTLKFKSIENAKQNQKFSSLELRKLLKLFVP